jgi:hypothetical protein
VSISHIGRFAVCALTTTLILAFAGCGGTQTTGNGGALPQGGTSANASEPHEASGASGDLLYVADGKATLLVFSYPQRAFVERIDSVPKPWALCSDPVNGNVFVLNLQPYQVLEFAHGATAPMNTLNLEYFAQSCSVDPKTGNLAVPQANSVAIFKGGSGNPQMYSDTDISTFDVCTYDNNGNLFVTGFTGGGQALTELNGRTDTFTNITLNQNIDDLYGIQWVGNYLAVNDFSGDNAAVYRLKISSSNGKVVGKTPLKGIVYG